MDKIFRFSKWFVLFCALLVAARLGQSYVADRAFEERASLIAEAVYGWRWPNPNGDIDVSSSAKVTRAKIIERLENDGRVHVEGNQLVMAPDTVSDEGIENLNHISSSQSSSQSGDSTQGAKANKKASVSTLKPIAAPVTGASGASKPLQSKFAAVLTLYKDKNKWILGKVEAE